MAGEPGLGPLPARPRRRSRYHPAGFIVGVHTTTGRLHKLELPTTPGADNDDPMLSQFHAGTGDRAGLTQQPNGICVALDGTIIAAGDRARNRMQAFDIGGNPVQYFAAPVRSKSSLQTLHGSTSDTPARRSASTGPATSTSSRTRAAEQSAEQLPRRRLRAGRHVHRRRRPASTPRRSTSTTGATCSPLNYARADDDDGTTKGYVDPADRARAAVGQHLRPVHPGVAAVRCTASAPGARPRPGLAAAPEAGAARAAVHPAPPQGERPLGAAGDVRAAGVPRARAARRRVVARRLRFRETAASVRTAPGPAHGGRRGRRGRAALASTVATAAACRRRPWPGRPERPARRAGTGVSAMSRLLDHDVAAGRHHPGGTEPRGASPTARRVPTKANCPAINALLPLMATASGHVHVHRGRTPSSRRTSTPTPRGRASRSGRATTARRRSAPWARRRTPTRCSTA